MQDPQSPEIEKYKALGIESISMRMR